MAYIGRDIFINNKYKTWHDNIIAKAKNRTLEGYKEVHHIIPKSCGGTNDKSNLVPLAAREHYIIHILLSKCIIKKYKFKMLKAIKCMKNLKNKNVLRDFKINNRLYDKLRKEYSKYFSIYNPSYRQEVKDKISAANLGKKRSKETREKMRGKKHTKETKVKIKYARQFQVCSDEQRKNYSKIYSNLIWVNKDNKSKRVNKELKKDYLSNGYKLGRNMSYMTGETRNLLSQKTTAYWQRKVA